MEELLRSLRNLELAQPAGDQLVALVDPDPRVEKRLAQELAVPAQLGADAGDAMFDAALMRGATEAMLQNYNRTLQKEIEAHAREREALQRPRKVKRVPLRALFAAQDALQRRRAEERAAAQREGAALYLPRQVLEYATSYCSATDARALQPLAFEELEAPRHFAGRYVVLRVVSRLSLYFSCTFLGMFPSGEALPVSIAYFTPNLRLEGEALDALLPVGTYLLVREPYVSTNHLGAGGPITGGRAATGIRVDTPSDVLVLDEASPFVTRESWAPLPAEAPSPPPARRTVWRQEPPLARAVRRGESVPGADRAGVHATVRELLADERPGAAWRELHAAASLQLFDGAAHVEDALLRADVLLALGAYAEAGDALRGVAGEPGAAARLDAARTGAGVAAHGLDAGQVAEMYARTLRDACPRFAYGDFIGPVEVADVPGAGRGLVLTRDVQEGELLLVCRAVGSSYSRDAGCDGVPLLRSNPDEGVTSTTTQVLAAARCIHTVLDRPEFARPLLGLTAGPAVAPSAESREPYPLRWPRAPADPLAAPPAERAVSARYVNGVLRFNAFGPAPTPAAASAGDPMARSTMPHPLPAILNHACVPNVSSVFFGDVVTTRALHPLPRGTEIVHQYVPGEVPYAARHAQLAKHEFHCGCALCQMDERDGPAALRRRDELRATSLPALEERSRALLRAPDGGDPAAHRELAASLLELLEALQGTYAPARPALRPDLVEVLHRAAQHVGVYDPAGAVRLEQASLGATGAVAEPGQPAAHEEQGPDAPSAGRPAAAAAPAAPVNRMGRRGRTLRLVRLPDLCFDAAVRALLAIASRLEADEALAWVDTAAYVHNVMIGGGDAVFLQRWADGMPDGAPAGEYAAVLRRWLAAC